MNNLGDHAMNIIQSLITDLREKRLWPVAAALIVALIAVPLLLSEGGNSNVPIAQIPPAGSANAPVPALPAVSVTPTPSNGRLTGRGRNPFTQQVKQSTNAQKTSSSSTASKAKASSGSTKSSTVSGAVGGGTTTVISTTTTPAVTTEPAPTGLTAAQAYHVAISMTNASGGAYIVDPVKRLSLLPSQQFPLLIELGVLVGGRHVLFTVQPGTVVRGPGACTPGPIDCEILALAPGQIEQVATTSNGSAWGALMSVTAIKADGYPSSSAADAARRTESAAGRRLLSASKLSALSLFQYRPGLGAVVDLSNLTVGGS